MVNRFVSAKGARKVPSRLATFLEESMRLAVIRVFIIGALSAAGAFGQSAAVNGQISGTVTDPSGAPVAAAHVEAVNAGTGYRQTVTTSSSGLFQLPLLPLVKLLPLTSLYVSALR